MDMVDEVRAFAYVVLGFGFGRGRSGFGAGRGCFAAAGMSLGLPSGGLSFLIKFFL